MTVCNNSQNAALVLSFITTVVGGAEATISSGHMLVVCASWPRPHGMSCNKKKKNDKLYLKAFFFCHEKGPVGQYKDRKYLYCK